MERNISLDVALEHFAAATQRGEQAGAYREYYRILDILKKNGHYTAVLALKPHEPKTGINAS